jgi:hypothetical protein
VTTRLFAVRVRICILGIERIHNAINNMLRCVFSCNVLAAGHAWSRADLIAHIEGGTLHGHITFEIFIWWLVLKKCATH